ncbi:Transcriptional regulator AcuR [Mycobacterium simulans]|uniref:TetR/AcrR family transcriptional regulator n=1 Tax=Mycobacterium simulans TaxID=627089 RepID=UPI00174B1EFD|nr:TetR/AcrR family transcriptional regulator [Mycobacterium simulans]SON58958.1 Transcriptional regulator AcuR [Mycobacterium simulans]
MVADVPRPVNTESRAKLLAAGLRLICQNGVNATCVKEVAEQAGVPKGSFYSYFASKDDFVVGVLEHYWAEMERRFGHLLDDGRPPLERLTMYFRSIADDHERNAFTIGCLLGILGQELAGSKPIVAERLRAILLGWEIQLASVFVDADQRQAREVAASIIEAWQGAVFRAKTDISRKPYMRFEEVTLPLLVAICDVTTLA